MSTDPELDAMAIAASAFAKLDQQAQVRVFTWLGDKLGLWELVAASKLRSRAQGASKNSSDDDRPDDSTGWISTHPKVTAWLKQSKLTADELDRVFFVGPGGELEIIAPEIPGKSAKDRALHVYMLTGLAEFLRTGSATFSDELGRKLCKAAGCFDITNHSKYMNDKGSALAGSKEKGWSLTSPGLRDSANLVREAGAAT